MNRNDPTTQKTLEALQLMANCFGERGIHASPDRYRGQCWTRDFALAVQPALFAMTEDNFPLTPYGSSWWLGRARELAARHLRELTARMRPNAQVAKERLHGSMVPILFLDGPAAHARFLLDKVGRSFTQGRMSFMLRRYLQGKLWQLTPGTTDSELMFCHAVLEHAEMSGDDSLKKDLEDALDRALVFIETRHLDSIWPGQRVLHVGGDWRDTMEKELADKSLLSNNAILYAVYKRLGWDARAKAVQDKIRARRDPDGLLLDYEGAEWFDPLGGALAVIYDLATPEDYPGILRGFHQVDTPRGVTIRCKHNAYGETPKQVATERMEIDRTGGEVIWPFVGWFTVLAAAKIARLSEDPRVKFAAAGFRDAQQAKLLKLPGFYEWYSPDTGAGWGAPRQLWSAAMFLRATHAEQNI